MARLAFLCVEQEQAKGGYVGGLLVTDAAGLPVEFFSTLPVRPTAVQRAVYGRALDRHVSVELCGRPLLQRLAGDVDALVLGSPSLAPLAADTRALVAVTREDRPDGAPLIYAIRADGYIDDPNAEASRAARQALGGVDPRECLARVRDAIGRLPVEDARYT